MHLKKALTLFLLFSLLFQFFYFSGKAEARVDIYQPSVAAGLYHSLFLMPDGNVKGVGYNSNRQVGYGSSSYVYTPTQLNLTNIRQIAAGETSSYALNEKGEVYVWGNNSNGQLGTGNTTTVQSPTKNTYLTNVVQIAAGSNFAVALMKDGTLKAWGDNTYGQLGNGTYTASNTPITVPGLTNIKKIAIGRFFVVALLENGSVKTWGLNDSGQLGLGHTNTGTAPVTVSGLTAIKDVAAGTNHAAAVLTNGTVKTWGNNSNGQLGIGSTTNQLSPVTISGLTNVYQVSLGGYHSIAILNDGKVKMWGKNSNYQLGLSGTTNRTIPTDLQKDNVLHAVAGSEHSFLIFKDYTLHGSGSNTYYQLGGGDNNTRTIFTTISLQVMTVPMQVEGFIDEPFIAAGASSSFAYTNGVLRAFGVNTSGQLGIGNKDNQLTPVTIQNLNAVKQLASGNSYTLALIQDGSVKAWGNNSYGQLGLGNTTSQLLPTTVPSLSGVKQIATGSAHTLALMEDGTVKAWGYNGSGELGLGNTTNQLQPITVQGLSGVKQIATGSSHTLALMEDGSVKAWGSNANGQLGLGNTSSQYRPITVPGLSGVKQIAAGSSYTLALMEDGTVKAWGYNGSGELGLGNMTEKWQPVTIPDLNSVKQITTGSSYTLALMEDGSVKAWGSNISGQLGLGNKTNQLQPATVPDLSGVRQIAAGSSHTMALMEDGSVKAWGSNASGQLGLGNTTNQLQPITVPALSGVKQIAAGTNRTLALMEDGTVKAWGYSGQLPKTVPDLSGVKQLATGSTHTLALMEDGTVKSWGSNASGQLGLGNTTDQLEPITVKDISGVKQLVASSSHSLALMEDGTVMAWGGNFSGQLGLGNTTNQLQPITVSGLSGVKQLATGTSHTLALMEDGSVKAWGNNSSGELGLGNKTNQLQPINVPDLNRVKQLATGSSHTLALMEDGSVKAWGSSSSGQLGLGNMASQLQPTTVPGLSGVKQLASGALHSLALMEDGSVKAWGSNSSGQLGLGTTSNTTFPVNVTEIRGAIHIAAGSHYSFALLDGAVMMGWGEGREGQLGNGLATSFYTPQAVPLHNRNLVFMSLLLQGMTDSTIVVSTYLDEEATPLYTTNIQLSDQEQYLRFEPFDSSTLIPGAHKFIIEAGDGVQLIRKEVHFQVSNMPSGNTSIQIEATPQTLTVKAETTGALLDAAPYRISVGETVSNWLTGNPSAAFTVSNLLPNTRYPVQVEVKQSNGQITTERRESVTYAVSPSLVAAGTSATTATFTINDTNPADTAYQIITGNKFVASDGTLTAQSIWITIPDKRILIKGLPSGATSKFQIKARNKEGVETPLSASIQAGLPIKPPAIPTGFKAEAFADQIELTWNPVLDATAYELELDGTVLNRGALLSFIHRDLAPNTTHLYRIRALKDGASSEWSEPITVRTLMPAPLAPGTVNASATGRTVTIAWGSVLHALSYELEWDGRTIRVGREITSYKIMDLSPGSQHVYRLRAVNSGGAGPWSPLRTVMTAMSVPPMPTGLTIHASDTAVQINWQSHDDVTHYEIMANGVIFLHGSAPSVSLGGLQPGSNYQYSVRAWNELGASAWSSPISVTTYRLASPKLVRDSLSDTTISLRWETIPGASGYEIERNGMVEQVNTTNFNHSELLPETTYTYRIRALSSSGNSGWSLPMSLTTLPAKPAIPDNIYAVAGKDYITLNWTAVTTALGYEVEIDGKAVMSNFGETTYTDTMLDPFTPHTYRIRAVTDAVQGDWTAAIAMRTLPDVPKAPDNIMLSSIGHLVTLSWAENPSALRYELEMNGQVIDVGLQTSYTHRRVVSGTENRYRVRTYNEAGMGGWSNLMVNNTINARLTKGKDFNLGLTASDITDFSRYTLTVSYDPNAMKVLDLSSLTGQPELAPGRIEGTDIIITHFSPGRITFVTDKPIQQGESWTGVINSIKFQGLASGGSSITYTVVQQS
ncbi:RCC1 domain-containing protein [Paenibacillus sp. IITD108]|uniref:RCC1 domain-containing protein n=1 Tax=Paenibacillus sp. IITD108 TaxID=3116649 RepID=UPI002F3F7F72